MAETQRIEGRGIETHFASVTDVMAAPRAALERARAECLEKAVLANAEGWQSGPIEFDIAENPATLALEARVWMVMTRG